jgi:hypothetical protein
LPPGSAAAVVQLPTGIDERRGRVPAAPRPLCLAPFSQDPMIGNYHTQIKVTVRYISTLQLPGVVHVGRFSSVFPNLWNERMRDNCRRSACVGIIQSRRREISRRSREFEICARRSKSQRTERRDYTKDWVYLNLWLHRGVTGRAKSLASALKRGIHPPEIKISRWRPSVLENIYNRHEKHLFMILLYIIRPWKMCWYEKIIYRFIWHYYSSWEWKIEIPKLPRN